MVDATTAYLEAEDAVAAWVDDRCERDAAAWESSAALVCVVECLGDNRGGKRGLQRRFAQTLESRGFQPQRHKHGRGFLGLRIIPIEVAEPYWRRDG